MGIFRDGQTQSCGAENCVIDSAAKVPVAVFDALGYMLERWMALDREVETAGARGSDPSVIASRTHTRH